MTIAKKINNCEFEICSTIQMIAENEKSNILSSKIQWKFFFFNFITIFIFIIPCHVHEQVGCECYSASTVCFQQRFSKKWLITLSCKRREFKLSDNLDNLADQGFLVNKKIGQTSQDLKKLVIWFLFDFFSISRHPYKSQINRQHQIFKELINWIYFEIKHWISNVPVPS